MLLEILYKIAPHQSSKHGKEIGERGDIIIKKTYHGGI